MNTEKNKSKFNLKAYHLILLSCLLGTIFVLNSNYVNEKRTEDKLNKEKNTLFNEIMSKRALQESVVESGENSGLETKTKKSDNICENGSEDLKAYYKSGDLSKIDLEDKSIECKDKNKNYMKDLINMIREVVGEDENMEPISGKKVFGIHLNLLINYCLRFLALLIILVIGIFSIIGWTVCCCCSCCDCCCCCCCCKKEGCKVPCFVFTYIFYGLAIIACIYGLSQSNQLFEGLANTECSLLRLMEQVTNGEVKQSKPRWIGINPINELLTNLTKNIENLKDTAYEDLLRKKGEIGGKKETFTSGMTKFDRDCYNEGHYLEGYTKKFDDVVNSDYHDKTYVLDILKRVGHKNDDDKYPENTFLYMLNAEYSEVAKNTDDYIETSEKSFKDILKNETDKVIKALNDSRDTLDKLRKPFDKYYDKIGDVLVDYSGEVDKYGKLGVKLSLTILMLINAALAFLLICICCCSLKPCTSCCCFRCLFKFCTHIFWNVLALMMIITLLIGSLFAIVGKLGNDGMSLVSYVVSKENLENVDDPFLIGKAQDVIKYLKICLHGNGSLESEFDLGDSLEHIEDIDDVLNKLDNVTQIFNEIKENLPSFKVFRDLIKERTDYTTDKIYLLNNDDSMDFIPLYEALFLLNESIALKSTKKESWSINGEKAACNSFGNGEYIIHPQYCKPIDRQWIKDSSDQSIKDPAIIVSAIIDLVAKLKDTSADSLEKKLSALNALYNEYLNSYLEMLDFLKKTINNLIGELRDKVGNGKLFDFLNGKFIGTNLNILLKYLKESLGDDFYKVGICLILIGFSLLLSISSTLILLSIINLGLKNNINAENNPRFIREKNFNASEERKLADK